MNIAIHDADGGKFPNLALRKLRAWHKIRGDHIELFNPLFKYDRIYSSKVFTFTEVDPYLHESAVKGGIGYELDENLPEEVEHTCPDYSGLDYSFGFLTRGCNRNCAWCVVPKKEGPIRAHAEIEEFARHRNVLLMDNNILAHSHGIKQLEKIAHMPIRIDLNQGVDAWLIDNGIARLFGKIRWWKPVRLALDHSSQKRAIAKAVDLLRHNNVTPSRYSCYVLINNISDALDRVEFLRSLNVDPFVQPFIDRKGTPPPKEHKHFARWVNHKAIFRSCRWDEYRRRSVGLASAA